MIPDLDETIVDHVGAVLKGSESKLVLVHDNADGDAAGSAAALADTFPNVTVGIFDSPSALGKRLFATMNVNTVQSPEPSDYDHVIVIDTSGPGQLSGCPELNSPIVIDHHVSSGNWKGNLMIVDTSSTSTAELLAQLMTKWNITPSKRSTLALLAGTVSDTGHFRFAKPQSLENAASLLKLHDIRMEEVLEIIESEGYFNVSRRIAGFKSFQRSRFLSHGDLLVASSQISSFESWACKLLIVAGADVAFVGSQHKDDFRISCRAKGNVVKRGFHAGVMLESLGRETGGQGGGHDAAAGLSGKGDVEAVLNMCMERAVETIKNCPKSDNA